MNVSFISAFIAFFFFSYGKKIEKDVLENQIQYIVDDLQNNVDFIFPSEESKKSFGLQLNAALKTPGNEGPTQEDKDAEESNMKLIKKSVLVMGTILIIGLNTCWFMSKRYDFDFWDMLKHNLIILVAAGATEFCFLTYFAQHWRIADRNKVKYQILDSVKDALR